MHPKALLNKCAACQTSVDVCHFHSRQLQPSIDDHLVRHRSSKSPTSCWVKRTGSESRSDDRLKQTEQTNKEPRVIPGALFLRI